jgi:site-specific DNA-methyltransferase (adenine-specific)
MAKIQGYNASSEFGTPQDLYDFLNGIYGPFDLDVAASKENAKCEEYFTKEDNGKVQPWHGRVWCNPPYTNGDRKQEQEIAQWVEKAKQEVWHQKRAISATMLVKANTDQQWFHTIMGTFTDIYFIQGRVKYDSPGYKSGASFPSLVINLSRSKSIVLGSIWKYEGKWHIGDQR